MSKARPTSGGSHEAGLGRRGVPCDTLPNLPCVSPSKIMAWRNSLNVKLGGIAFASLLASSIPIVGNLYLLSTIEGDAAAMHYMGQGRMCAYHSLFLARKQFDESGEARRATRRELESLMDDIEARLQTMRAGDPSRGIPPAKDPRVLLGIEEGEQAWRTRVEPSLVRLGPTVEGRVPDFSELDREMSSFIGTIGQAAESYATIAEEKIHHTRAFQYLFIAIMIVSFSLVLWIVRRISGWVRSLAHTAERIAAGELGLEAPVAATDDLVILSDSFNAMMETLRTTIGTEKLARTEVAKLLETVATITKSLASATAEALVGPTPGAQQVVTAVDHVDDGLVGVGTITQQVESITQSFVALAEQAQVIGELITTVDAISEGTNRLAPVDGQQAPGLRSIAAEVEALAGRARKATTRAQRILGEIQGRVRVSEGKYRGLMEHANDAILIIDVTGKTLEANRQAECLLGRPVAEIVDRPYSDLVIASERDYAMVEFQKLLVEQHLDIREIHLQRTPNSVVCVDISAALVPLDSRGVVLAIVRDMTERNQLQRQLLQNEKLHSVGMLAAGTAHEINNPIMAVLANLRFIADQVGALPELGEVIDDCTRAAERIRDVVRNLKGFARIDDDDVGRVDVNALLDMALRMASNEIRHRARVEKNFGRDVPMIVASPGKLGQVFLNLVVNATQALEDRRVDDNRISITTGVEGERVRIDVADTGSGIPEDVLPRIFDPFFTTKPVGEGTGLGLAICQDIIEKHHGEIRVQSTVGHGTTFTIYLPRETGLALPYKKSAPVEPSVESRARLLVVDDEPSLLRTFQRMLAPRHDVTVALGGRAAVECLSIRGHDYDVILCDLMMPDLDGVDLHRYVGEHFPGLERRIVFITGGAFTARTRDFLARIDNLRLEKPFESEALRRTIATMLAKA